MSRVISTSLCVKTFEVILSLFHDNPASESAYAIFSKDQVLARLKALDSLIHRKGLSALKPQKSRLIRIGTEIDSKGHVAKNCYGVFNLSWQFEQHPEWPDQVMEEVEEVRSRIKKAHGARLRFLIWAGMGGSAEDKLMFNAHGTSQAQSALLRAGLHRSGKAQVNTPGHGSAIGPQTGGRVKKHSGCGYGAGEDLL